MHGLPIYLVTPWRCTRIETWKKLESFGGVNTEFKLCCSNISISFSSTLVVQREFFDPTSNNHKHD